MSTRASQQARRNTESYRLARAQYRRNPEVKAKAAVRRAMKKHQTPSPIVAKSY